MRRSGAGALMTGDGERRRIVEESWRGVELSGEAK
jgi:hypothetical protein